MAADYKAADYKATAEYKATPDYKGTADYKLAADFPKNDFKPVADYKLISYQPQRIDDELEQLRAARRERDLSGYRVSA